eukprot:3795515-Prymnesium_polylepis.1
MAWWTFWSSGKSWKVLVVMGNGRKRLPVVGARLLHSVTFTVNDHQESPNSSFVGVYTRPVPQLTTYEAFKDRTTCKLAILTFICTRAPTVRAATFPRV